MKKCIGLVLLALYTSAIYPNSAATAVLLNLNKDSLNAYAQAKNAQLKKLSPVIIALGDHLVLYQHRKRTQYPIIPTQYTELKTYAQLSLGIFSIAQQKTVPFETLTLYRAKIIAANNVLPATSLNVEQQARQRKIIRHTLAFIDSVLDQRKISPSVLDCFLHKTIPLVWQNVNEATVAQLKLVQQRMNTIKHTLPHQDWKNLSVIVVGPHMPRQDNVLMQYFAKLLQTPRLNDRLVYGENLSNEQQALELMARIKLDTTLGEVVFQEKYRMHRDLLGDAAKNYLARQSNVET